MTFIHLVAMRAGGATNDAFALPAAIELKREAVVVDVVDPPPGAVEREVEDTAVGTVEHDGFVKGSL